MTAGFPDYRQPFVQITPGPRSYADRTRDAVYEHYINSMDPAQRVRWELTNASQRLAITSKAYRRARHDYLMAENDFTILDHIVQIRRQAMCALNDERYYRGRTVSDLRFRRDRKPMGPMGNALFQIFGGQP